VLYFAEREGWIAGRPRWKRQRLNNARLFTFTEAQDKEALAYFQAIQQPTMADLYTLGVDAGLRLGELLSLEGQRVDLKSGLVHVTGELAKNGEDRHVVLTSRAKGVLASRIERFGKGMLFPTWTRRMVSHYMQALREHLGVETAECCFHATRHTCGSRMAIKGVPLKVMMDQLGHKRPEMSLRYIHATATERKRVILEAMETGKDAVD
jgi:integrase